MSRRVLELVLPVLAICLALNLIAAAAGRDAEKHPPVARCCVGIASDSTLHILYRAYDDGTVEQLHTLDGSKRWLPLAGTE
jgi:hypothetical protein